MLGSPGKTVNRRAENALRMRHGLRAKMTAAEALTGDQTRTPFLGGDRRSGRIAACPGLC